MQTVSNGDNLHERSNPVVFFLFVCFFVVFLNNNKRNISTCRLLKILPRVLRINVSCTVR